MIPRALPGAGCDFQVSGIPEHPGTPPAPISLSETAGLAACRETGMVGSLGGPVVAIRSGPTVPIATVRSGRDGLDPDVVGGSCNHRRSVASARCVSPGRRLDSTAWPNGRSPVTVRSRCGLDLLRVCPLCQPSKRRSVPLPPPSDWGQRAEMKPVASVRYGRFASRVEGFRDWRALSAGLSWGGQPLRWRLSGDTDAMWLDRCGEAADRPVFHTLTEQLPVPTQQNGFRNHVD